MIHLKHEKGRTKILKGSVCNIPELLSYGQRGRCVDLLNSYYKFIYSYIKRRWLINGQRLFPAIFQDIIKNNRLCIPGSRQLGKDFPHIVTHFYKGGHIGNFYSMDEDIPWERCPGKRAIVHGCVEEGQRLYNFYQISWGFSCPSDVFEKTLCC